MAGDTELTENSAKVFKCHSNLRVPKIVVCIICENVYHANDFNRLNKGKYVSEMFVVCPAHCEEDLTSKCTYENIELSEDARKIITQIKLFEKEKCKEDISKNISLNLTKENLLHETVIEDDLAMLRVENDLLKQLNHELKDKNALLQDLVAKNAAVRQDTCSYADMVKQNISDKREVIPDIIVKAKNKNNNNTMAKVKSKILSDITVPIQKITANKNGEVTIKCKDKVDVSRTTALLKEKMSKDYEVEAQAVKAPRLKIHDVQNDMNLTELEEDIKNRNLFMLSGNFTLISEYRNARKQRVIILEVSSELYNNIVNNDYRLFIGFQCCKMYDIINLSVCFKCGRLNHNSRNCKNETKCLKCAGKHPTNKCDSSSLKCVNCDFYNEKFGQNKCTNHHPNDTASCEYLKHRLQKLLNKMDYPILPKVPKLLGKIPGQGKTDISTVNTILVKPHGN